MSDQIRLLDRDGNPCTVNIEDLIAIKPTADGPEFYTKDSMYFYPTTLDELLILFKDLGFERLDRTNLVNLNHVKAFDPKARKVYFEHPWSKDSKFATVSEANVSKVQHLAKEEQAKYKVFPKPSLFWKK
ncbi:LytTR family transcriptional regulator DNA-binding domain-containing protein [Cohnella cholangitidis]|uniref:LytTR family transcriptional regulator n=1 Tax=Cohnella cholangitidis TaxID=2598458 RepID=A0A7G5C2U5_9BACL|nr:LytTR family transcriptional regulator DNA-binding domain-containing protein [Cohnella cholangitidis]QMV43529.1 LytTR family transcriptional regulator [Cohnella cholangitidis]